MVRLTRRALLGAVLAGAAGCSRTAGRALGHPPVTPPRSGPGSPAAMPAVTTTVADGVTLPAADWVRRENARPGTPGWGVPPGQVDHAIEGYLGAVSAVTGQAVPLFVSTRAARFTVHAYRIGYYGGTGARLVWQGGPYPGERQPIPAPQGTTRLVECAWRPAATIPVTADWVPGVYLLKLVGSGGEQQFVPFTVRDDASRAAFAILNAVTTWQAYNRWGGYSLYLGDAPGGADFANRARVVSFDRPYTVEFGNGAGDLLGNELPLVMLCERHGLDVTYWTDIDLHLRPELLAGRGALLSLGHDEYWSRTMYDAALRARDAGVNLAFFGANACYRHIRLDPGPNGPARREVCYKVATEDPLYGVDDAEVTANWPAGPDPRPESQLVGDMYQSYPVDAPLVVSGSWLFAGTGLAPGAGIPEVIGSEYDAVSTAVPFAPDLDVLAHSPVVCRGVPGFSDATWYTVTGPGGAPGGGVFASGTASWIIKLADARGAALQTIPSAIHGVTPAMTRATLNVLAAVGFGPASARRPATGSWRRYYRGSPPPLPTTLP